MEDNSKPIKKHFLPALVILPMKISVIPIATYISPDPPESLFHCSRAGWQAPKPGQVRSGRTTETECFLGF
jgi:hypothetical protein